MEKDNILGSQRLETVKTLKSSIKINLEEKWWLKEEYQPKEYQEKEIERSMNKIIQIFDNQWVDDVLNEWLRDQRKNHLMIRYLVGKGSYQLGMLVGLGNDLIEIETLKNSERLIKDIKNSAKFIPSALEAEIAAECVRRGFGVELYPDLCGKIPDLKIIFNSKNVYFEITEIHPSQREHSLHKILDNLFYCITPLIPENTRLRLTPNKLISRGKFNQIKSRLKHILKDNSSRSTSFQISDLFIEVKKERDDWGKSLYITIPSDLIDLELERLKDRIKKEANQISKPNLGVIVVDATNILSSAFNAIARSIKEGMSLGPNLILSISLYQFEPLDKEAESKKEVEVTNKIKGGIKEILEKNNYSNILAVVVIRSFKFFKKENEIIIVENPNCKELQLLKKIEELYAFSRAINL